MKIAILTHPLHINYGGLLQAYALQQQLIALKHEVVTDIHPAPRLSTMSKVIDTCKALTRRCLGQKSDNPLRLFFPTQRQRRTITQHTDRFIRNHIYTIDLFAGQARPSAEQIAPFDALVVGSDQVWRPLYQDTPAYFLDFTAGFTLKRVAYAASFGLDNWSEYNDQLTACCAEGAKLFDAISVREDSAVALCLNHLGVEATHVLDPTLLLESSDYLRLIEPAEQAPRDPLLMCYLLDKTAEKEEIRDCIATHFGLPILEVMSKTRFSLKKRTPIADCIFPSLSAWLAGFRDARFVVTDSFHGVAFALIFNRPFVVIANHKRGRARFTSLLKMVGLENRLIACLAELTPAHYDQIDYREVNEKLAVWRAKSIGFLITHLGD